jgi:hypothetical protein
VPYLDMPLTMKEQESDIQKDTFKKSLAEVMKRFRAEFDEAF